MQASSAVGCFTRRFLARSAIRDFTRSFGKEIWSQGIVFVRRSPWDNCPTLGQVAPAPVATDLDLILYNSDRGYYVYSSQSVTDSVEGFDVDIHDDGHYEIYWTYPDGSVGCDALGSYRMEPFAYAVAWWTSQ